MVIYIEMDGIEYCVDYDYQPADPSVGFREELIINEIIDTRYPAIVLYTPTISRSPGIQFRIRGRLNEMKEKVNG